MVRVNDDRINAIGTEGMPTVHTGVARHEDDIS